MFKRALIFSILCSTVSYAAAAPLFNVQLEGTPQTTWDIDQTLVYKVTNNSPLSLSNNMVYNLPVGIVQVGGAESCSVGFFTLPSQQSCFLYLQSQSGVGTKVTGGPQICHTNGSLATAGLQCSQPVPAEQINATIIDESAPLNWTSLGNLTDPYYSVSDIKVAPNGDVFATTDRGLMTKANGQTEWRLLDTKGAGSQEMSSLALLDNGLGGTTVYTSEVLGGAYVSTDGGDSWHSFNSNSCVQDATYVDHFSDVMSINPDIGLIYNTIHPDELLADEISGKPGLGCIAYNDTATTFAPWTSSQVVSSINLPVSNPTHIVLATAQGFTGVAKDDPNMADDIAKFSPNGLPTNAYLTAVADTNTKEYFALASLQENGTGSGVYVEANDGTWSVLSDGWPTNDNALFLAADTNELFAVSQTSGIFKLNTGNAWIDFNTNLPADPILSFTIDSSNHLYVAIENNGVWTSDTSTADWSQLPVAPINAPVIMISPTANHIYATDHDTIVEYDGTSWSTFTEGLPELRVGDVVALTKDANNLYVSIQDRGVYVAVDSHLPWVALSNTGLPIDPTTSALTMSTLTTDGTNLYLGFTGCSELSNFNYCGIYKFDTTQHTWSSWSFKQMFIDQLFFDAQNSKIIASSQGSGTIMSHSLTATDPWHFLLTSSGIFSNLVWQASNDALYALSSWQNILGSKSTMLFKSTDEGRSWTVPFYDVGQTSYESSYQIARSENYPFAQLNNILYWAPVTADDQGLLQSTDNGVSWTPVATGTATVLITALTPDATAQKLYIGTVYPNPVLDINNGAAKAKSSRVKNTINNNLANSGLYTFDGTTTTAANALPSFVRSLAQLNNTDGSLTLFAGTWGNGLLSSTDSGKTWIAVTTLKAAYIREIIVINNVLYAGTSRGLYISKDRGQTWNTVEEVVGSIWQLKNDNDSIYVIANHGGIARVPGRLYVSDDNGQTWAESTLHYNSLSKRPRRDLAVIHLPNSTQKKLLITSGEGIQTSEDGGNTWEYITAFNNHDIWNLVVDATDKSQQTIYAAGDDGIWRSTDAGITWTQLGLVNEKVRTLIQTPSGRLFAGTVGDGVFQSDLSGTNWSAVGQTLGNQTVFALLPLNTPSGNFLLAGTPGGLFSATYK